MTDLANSPKVRKLLAKAADPRTPKALSEIITAQVADLLRPEPTARCEELARKGTGEGTCDRPLDGHSQCDRAANHVS